MEGHLCYAALLGALGWVRGRHRPGVRPTTGAATVTGNTSFADARDGDNNTATVAATPARPRAPKHPQYPTQVGAQATATDENQPFAVVAMLIGELHGHTATERLTDHRRPGDAKFIEQITQPHRERTQRIVTARLLSVTNFVCVGLLPTCVVGLVLVVGDSVICKGVTHVGRVGGVPRR